MSTSLTSETWLLTAGALVGAATVVWNGIGRPLRKLVKLATERVEEWSAAAASVKELIPLVARLVVESDRRLSRLETVLGLDQTPRAGEDTSLLADQLRARLRDPQARTRRDDQENLK